MCVKIRFETRKDAKKYIKRINKIGEIEKRLTNVYFCAECNGFHTTSKSKRKSRKMTQWINKILNDGVH